MHPHAGAWGRERILQIFSIMEISRFVNKTPGSAIHVAVAVIQNGMDKVFICQRKAGAHQGGLWEFPGGKLEAGESVTDALKRECLEEIGIEVISARQLLRVHHAYEDINVLLDVWKITEYAGVPHGNEGQNYRWVEKNQLSSYKFPKANNAIISALLLPTTYLITPEPKSDLDAFFLALNRSFISGVKLLQLRAKNLNIDEYIHLAIKVADKCRKEGARLILNAHPDILDIIDVDGIHLTSISLFDHSERPITTDKLLSASCHNEKEIAQAAKLEVDFAVISPVLLTQSHPDLETLGWNRFRELADIAPFPVYALGGMATSHINMATSFGAQGIAGISGLWRG